VAVGGLFFFALIAVIAGFSGRKSAPVERHRGPAPRTATPDSAADAAPAYIFALSTVGLAFVLYLAYASFFVLKAFCILCAITYVAVIAIFVISGGAAAVPMSALPGRAMRDLRSLAVSPVALVVAALFAIGAVSVKFAFPREGSAAARVQEYTLQPLTDDERTRIAQWWDVQPKVDVPISSDGAKVLVVKFNDFQCPPCRQTYDLYNPIFAKYEKTGQFKFVLKHFPLEPECNAAVQGTVHPAACEAAAADVMARAKGSGTADKLEAWLFAHQGPPLLTPAQVKDAARDVAGINDFDARYQSALVEVRNDAGMGALIGVKSTPTFVINGRMTGAQDPRVIDGVIDLELKRAK
jgi:protein-disulfide isomerase